MTSAEKADELKQNCISMGVFIHFLWAAEKFLIGSDQASFYFNECLTLILTAMEFKEPHFEKRK
jgi:hypothetical protein